MTFVLPNYFPIYIVPRSIRIALGLDSSLDIARHSRLLGTLIIHQQLDVVGSTEGIPWIDFGCPPIRQWSIRQWASPTMKKCTCIQHSHNVPKIAYEILHLSIDISNFGWHEVESPYWRRIVMFLVTHASNVTRAHNLFKNEYADRSGDFIWSLFECNCRRKSEP